jgi:CRP-like cAMP-binding protein
MVSSQPPPSKLSPDLLKALHGIRPVHRFQKGVPLFHEGSAPTGASQKQLLEVATPGTMLGLSESMSGEKYRATAEAGDQTTAIFIPREEFLAFLREHGDFCVQIVRLLSEDLHALYDKFRSITAHPGRPRQRPLDEQLN